MFHIWTNETPIPPDHSGQAVRHVDTCIPRDLYWTYIGPAPEKKRGGPRANIRTAGGRIYDIPISMLTTAEPLECDVHEFHHRHMVEMYVHGTRRVPTNPGGKNRRETAKERDERLSRWERVIR